MSSHSGFANWAMSTTMYASVYRRAKPGRWSPATCRYQWFWRNVCCLPRSARARSGSDRERFEPTCTGPKGICHSQNTGWTLLGYKTRHWDDRSAAPDSNSHDDGDRSHQHQPSNGELTEHEHSTDRTFNFLTNNFTIPAQTVADLYRYRWQVELFFKWIKQHLRIKSFFGVSENAVKSQIWIAISVYVLVAIIKKRLGLKIELYTILQILSLTLFEKTPLDQLLMISENKTRWTKWLTNWICLI